MLNFQKIDGTVLFITAAVFFTLLGACFVQIYRPEQKNIKIYKQALSDYQKGNYQNSYYLFSRISSNSNLKPFAIYRQSMSAKSLNDTKTELLKYKSLIKNYRSNPITIDANYKAGQLSILNNPQQALKYFNNVVHSNAPQDYKVASEFYISKIKNNSQINQPSDNIDNGYRNYLKLYPQGRLATDVANSWLEFNSNMSSSDYSLVAKAFYYANQPAKSQEALSKTNIYDSWPIMALVLKKQGKYDELKNIIYQGISSYSNEIDSSDYKTAIMEYLKTRYNVFEETSTLLNIAKGKNRDYIRTLKCKYAPYDQKLKCYNDLYNAYPKSEYSQDIVSNLIIQKVIHKDYKDIKNIAKNFISENPNSKQIPMIMFWIAKYENSLPIYNKIINKYPDSYYAYRAFLITNKIKTSVFDTRIGNKIIIYPYAPPQKSDVLYKLIKLKDYDMIEKYTDDEFIKSWAQYQKGDYILSMHTAKTAMDSLGQKPPKTDLRWRLVYPINYYEQIKKECAKYNNDEALIMALIKEESSFNPLAKSPVGAMGLMQLMPATAYEAAGYQFNTTKLLDPEFNIELGNIYYSSLKKQLNNKDISAIASYNGGIGAVLSWKLKFVYNDTDEFVEQIPYEETKYYVKKVFKSYWNYARIYQK